MTEETVRCERCDHRYSTDEPGCPRCRSIRRSNLVLGATLVMLTLLALVGWVGSLALS